LRLIEIYLNFLEYIFKEPGYHNYIDQNKKLNFERNSFEGMEDSLSRGIYALSVVASSVSLPEEIKEKAVKIFLSKIDPERMPTSPRASAFFIKALCQWPEEKNNVQLDSMLKKHTDYLLELYEKISEPNWQWFEDVLAYSNGVLPEAILWAYRKTGNQKYFNIAKNSLDFLTLYSFDEKNICIPVGQGGWFKKGGQKTLHDQQPEEVAVLVLALDMMWQISGENKYLEKAKKAFEWFLGNNTLEQLVYDFSTGGCYDGVGEKEINLNQGAESTLSFLLARLALEK
jgi:hypothetical protein